MVFLAYNDCIDRMNRSINVELELEAGDYVVVVKIDALRNEQIMPVEDVIRAFAKERREKLLRIGFAYDLAHSKGRIVETPEEKSARESYEKKKRDRERKKMAKLIMKQREEDRKHAIRQTMKKKKATEKARARAKARDERRQARREAKEKAEEEQRKKKDEEECADKSSQGTTAQGDTTSAKAKGTKGTDRLENKDSEAQAVPGDQKGARLEIPSDDKSVAEGSKDGNDSSTEPGDNTPASSTMFERTPVETEETQEEDAYVTAAEEEGESQPTASMEASKGEEPPPTPRVSRSKPEKAVPKKSADKAERPLHNHVDIGVQTGPGLPLPPRTPGPPPGYLYSPPPPPPPRGPVYDHPRGQRHALPPHLRGIPYASMRRPPPPPPGASSSCTSDASTDDGIEDLDSVSEVSEHEIDLYLEAQGKARAAKARAAKANQPSSPSPPSGPTCEDELNEFEKDPWNAVGVFGLRVYYKSDSGNGDDEIVKLRVERPNQWMWEDDSDDEADDEKEKGKGDDVKEAKEEANESQVLDIDDSGKDAVAENVTAEEKKEDERALEGEASAQTAPGDVEVVKQAGQDEGDSSKDSENGKEPGEPKAEAAKLQVEASTKEKTGAAE